MKHKATDGLGATLSFTLAAWAVISSAGPIVASPSAAGGYENAAAYSNLNAAVTGAVAKGVCGVRIPAGTAITVKGPIALSSGFAVVGENSDTSRIMFELMTPAGFSLNGVTGVVVRGVTLDGGLIKPDQWHSRIGVLIEGASERVTLEDIVFEKMPSGAIRASAQTAFLRVVRCRFRDGNNLSIQGGAGGHWIIMNNKFRRTGGIGINGEGHVIIGNVFEDVGDAVRSRGMSRSLMAQNVVLRARGHGVYQWPGANDGNVYAYNYIRRTGIGTNGREAVGSASGFQTWSGGNNLVAGNLFTSLAGYGINDSGNTLPLGNICSDNVVHGCGDPGVLVNLSDAAVIRRSRICHNASIGADLGTDVHIRVRVRRGAHGCWLVNNVIRDNAIPGVWAHLMTESLIQGNRILDNGRNPRVWPPARQAYAGQAGLWLAWAPNLVGDNEFAFNRIVGNTIGDTREDPKQKTQWYGIVAGDPRMQLDANDKWSFRSNSICWNDLRGNREAAIYFCTNANQDQIIHHNATNEATAGELDKGPALADAGPSLVIAGGSTVRLTAKRTRCPKGVDPASLQYFWRMEAGRGSALKIVGTNTPSPTISFPKLASPAFYGFVLRVTRPEAQDPMAGEYTEDKVFVATYDDESCGLRLPATFDGELASSAAGPEGFYAVPVTPTNGWQWGIRSGELAARLDGANGGGVRLMPEGKIFGQVAAVDMVATNPLAAGMSAGLVLANMTGAELPADGYFLGLHRGTGEAEASLKVIRFMGCKPAEFAGLTAGDARILHQGRWDGKRLQLGIQRVGEVYTFLVNGAAVAKDTLNVLDEPYFDGPVPTLIVLQVLASAGAAQAEICFDNLAIDHAASPPPMP